MQITMVTPGLMVALHQRSLTVRKLSLCSMSHHHDTFAKTKSILLPVAWQNVKFFSPLKTGGEGGGNPEMFNSLHLGKSKKFSVLSLKTEIKTTDVKPICCKSNKDNNTSKYSNKVITTLSVIIQIVTHRLHPE